jgi:hypothetical protein
MRPEIDLNNKYRVLLTEVLPYELPLMLNNEAFYRNMQDEQTKNLFRSVFQNILNKESWTIPFDYYIRHAGGEKSRKLSLMHPQTQLDCVELYEEYADYMLYHCSHSPFSIRYIDKKARCTFPAEEVGKNKVSQEDMEHPIEMEEDEIEVRYRSYFRYKKYDLSYKFFESDDNLRLEQKYSYMMTIDIASCFYHIYTHSLTWAVKSKDVAKAQSLKDTFENEFDKLMRKTNYGETNGILVGPEISRIFAEIILQRIDLAVIRKLRDIYGYRLGRDYEIRRYVDDSFIYAIRREILDNVCKVYKELLAFYKMDINMSKLSFYERPFTSDISDAKLQVVRMMANFKARYLNTDVNGDYIKTLKDDMTVFRSVIKQFRSIAHQFRQHYGPLNKYLLTLMLRQIRDEINAGRVPFLELMTAYMEVAFYVFSLDMHTTASYRLCSILDCLVKWSYKCNDVLVRQELMNRMGRETKRVLDIYISGMARTDSNLEVQNLLLALSRLIDIKVPVSQIEILFGINVSEGNGYDRLDYFQICTLLYIIENDTAYDVLKKRLELEIVSRLSSPEALRKSELTHLFFDIMTCPYVAKSTGRTVLENCKVCSEKKSGKKRSELAKPGRWFFDWDKQHSLTDFLKKKEYHSPYE